MGLTKQYRRFVANSSFGVIGSSKAGVQRIPTNPNWVACAKVETVIVWNVSTGEKVAEYPGDDHEVTALAVITAGKDFQGPIITAGYSNGTIRLFDLKSGECRVTLSGHKSAVTTLAFDRSGQILCSGARDSNVIVWDVVNESGLYRLKGHKGPITRCMFMKSRNALITSSKDTTIKFWDLDIQHCFYTIAAHMTEVWDFSLVKNEQYLISGTSDSELRVWRLTFKDSSDKIMNETIEPNMKKVKLADEDEEEKDEDEVGNDEESDLVVEKVGSILRIGQDKVSRLSSDTSDRILACHGSDNSVEMFLICSDDEVKKRCQKKAKKERRKIASGKVDSDAPVVVPEPTIQEEFRRLKPIKAGGKVRGLEMEVRRQTGKDMCISTLLTANNQIEVHKLVLEDKDSEPELVKKFCHPGHRSDVRTVAFSSDNTSILSGSQDSVKIWTTNSQICLRTIPSGYCLSSLFVPGDRQVVVGTKKGSLQIIDLASAEITEEVHEAHEKEIWSMAMTADQRGFVTASADQSVKFWSFELLTKGSSSTEKQLSVLHTKTLKLEEDALAVQMSADGRLIAVSLLDSTVKVFFVDSLKFFLSLYGHKLPALALDISSDSTLIATGSADKNVKIWGLDFGDCHKSIFAHDDSVTAVKFLPNTHMFFTAGKDGKVKQWDADNFERIITLDGHHGEIWSLAVSYNAKYVVSSGHDKTLRIWERSEEVLVLEDERETEREKEGDMELATGEDRPLPGQSDKEAGLATKKTVESEKGAERLMEAIELYKSYKEEAAQSSKPPQLPPLMLAYQSKTPEEFMAKMIELIKLPEIEQTLLVLPLDFVLRLLEVMEVLLEQKKSVEVVCRMFFFLVEIHYGTLSFAQDQHPLLQRVRDLAKKRLDELRDMVGFNMAALQYHVNKLDERQRALELEETVLGVKEKRRKKKNKEKALKTAIISL